MRDETKRQPASPAAFVAFVEEAWRLHLPMALLLTRNRAQAEELLQDGLVKVYVRWRKLSRHDDLHGYLRRVVINAHISLWRRHRVESLVAEVPESAGPQQEGHPDAEELRGALATLPPRQRAVVVLRHYEDLAEREVAGILGCSVGTVKSQHAKALAKLRRFLEPTRITEPTRMTVVERAKP